MQRGAAASLCHSGDVFRVVHWNVRRCVDLSGTSSYARVLQTLERLQPTLLTLNEVDMRQTPALLEDLSSAVGLPHSSFFGHVRGVYGNVLASAVPLSDAVHTHVEGGTEVTTKDGSVHRIARGLLSASLSALGVELRVGVTHLDHMSYEQRRVQMEHVLRTLGASGSRPLAAEQQCLLLGDLNALGRADYSVEEWAAHEAYNAAKGWGAPDDEGAAGGVLALLRAARFVDAYASLEGPPAWGRAPWTAHVLDAERPPYRIDYAWSRAPAAVGGRRLVPLAAFVELDSGEASDHQPLVVDFEAVAFDAGE
jgi:endonuclease/exonuclease/phosphatase family metal-dependent hydrolase